MADKCPLGEDCDLTLAYMMGAEKVKDSIVVLRRENERLRAALRESADELDAYYCAEYPGDHPYSKRKLAEAMASNPARAALEEGK